MSNCQNVKLSNCQNVKLSKFQSVNQIVKLSQYQMSCIIRVCRLSQRIDCVLIFSIFFRNSRFRFHSLAPPGALDVTSMKSLNLIILSDFFCTILHFLSYASKHHHLTFSNTIRPRSHSSNCASDLNTRADNLSYQSQGRLPQKKRETPLSPLPLLRNI